MVVESMTAKMTVVWIRGEHCQWLMKGRHEKLRKPAMRKEKCLCCGLLLLRCGWPDCREGTGRSPWSETTERYVEASIVARVGNSVEKFSFLCSLSPKL